MTSGKKNRSGKRRRGSVTPRDIPPMPPVSLVRCPSPHRWMTQGQLLALTGGRWETPPPPGWHPSGLYLPRWEKQPGSLIVPQSEQFRHGVNPERAHRAQFGDCALVLHEGQKPLTWHGPILRVAHVRTAIEALARYRRGCFAGKVIAITGSAGKSSTTAMLANALDAVGGGCYLSDFRRNTQTGVLAQMCMLPPKPHAAIEISAARYRAAPVLRPHISILTAIAPAHVSYLGGLESIADIKSEVFRALVPGGVALLCRDIPLFDTVHAVATAHAGTVLTYGIDPRADLRVLDYDGETVTADIIGDHLRYPLPRMGRHQAVNSLAVIAAVRSLDLDWRAAAQHCASATLPVGRGQHHDLTLPDGRRITIIDGSHNANSASIVAALDVLREAPVGIGGRRIAVLSDILELGSETAQRHAELRNALAVAKPDGVFLAGAAMTTHLAPLLPTSMLWGCQALAPELLGILHAEFRDGDTVLFKGSHGTELYRVVERLLAGQSGW